MSLCQVCKDPSIADKANKMLLQRASVRDVAAATGISKSVIGRHKTEHLEKALILEQPANEPQSIAASPKNEQKPAPLATTTASAPAHNTKAFTPPAVQWALTTPADYHNYLQWLQDKSTELVNRASDTDNLRLMQTAIKEARDNATAMAKAKGWIQDAAQNDNRQVNIFQGLSVEAMTSLRDSLRAALQPAMVTIEQEG